MTERHCQLCGEPITGRMRSSKYCLPCSRIVNNHLGILRVTIEFDPVGDWTGRSLSISEFYRDYNAGAYAEGTIIKKFGVRQRITGKPQFMPHAGKANEQRLERL